MLAGRGVLIALWLTTAALTGVDAQAQTRQRARVVASSDAGRRVVADWTGVYRLDLERSDRLYSVVSNASSNLPFGEQQRFFLDLTVRLAPPDQLAIERHGNRVQIASSRAPRITFDADGVTHTERSADGQTIRTRAVLASDRLTVMTGGGGDRFTVVFEPLDGGRSLRVTRYIAAPQLNQPVVVHSVYDRISDVARWEIYGEPEARTREQQAGSTATPAPHATGVPVAALERDAAGLRAALNDWIAATNARDIDRQMSFYLPTLQAFYLQRTVPRASVRAEKARVFNRASVIDIRAAEPEILFRDGGATAVMRFRKSYVITGGGQDRRGEVIQELRWQRTPAGWRIASERDVKVLR
ncbi:MAG TPA: nuclear transport factor 2 family protein [Pyrinomonadaceae bacterium]|jgi:ketosteroid isomerase-like protein